MRGARPGRTLMVQGTASGVGKSLIVTALCRWLRQDGLSVAPFKSQNMALNSAVTPDGLEIGRAQAVQARAAGVPAHVDMNPILLKPESGGRCQVVVMGRPYVTTTARGYYEMRAELEPILAASLERLRARHDVVVIEGAGSPAEINLAEQDIVNMHVARTADAPVLLVGDIDRGGVFAALVGTMELLEPADRARVAGFVVNRFRGDPALLGDGLARLEERTGVPVLGVVPHVGAHRIPEEDSLGLDERARRGRAGPEELEIAVVRLPHLSNYDDLAPFEDRAGVVVRFVTDPGELDGADLVVLPGSKSTRADLAWLERSGLADRVRARAREGAPLLGICGGCQMLGREIDDPAGVEGAPGRTPGLGLLPVRTVFGSEKRTTQVRARASSESFVAAVEGERDGYEIHMGRLELDPGARATFEIVERNGAPERAPDGAVEGGGAVVGTMIHGLFERPEAAEHLLASLRARRGLAAPRAEADRPADPYDALAGHVRAALDAERLRAILEGRT